MMIDKREIILKTECCNIIFSLRENYHRIEPFDFDIKCEMAEKFVNYFPERFFCRLYDNDLKRLIQLFEKHYQGLKDGSLCESPVYMPLEADFQLKCLDGEVESSVDGSFSISILFNCGKANENSSNTYFGFETVVDLLDLKKFCDDLAHLGDSQ